MNSAIAVLDESNDEYRAFASGALTAQDCDERPLCADIVAKVCRLTSFKFLETRLGNEPAGQPETSSPVEAVEVSIEKMRGGPRSLCHSPQGRSRASDPQISQRGVPPEVLAAADEVVE
jgi:hypothetical protein